MLIHDAPMFLAVAALSPKEKNEFVRQVGFFTGLLRTGVRLISCPKDEIKSPGRGSQ
jgi:hypothetical protein